MIAREEAYKYLLDKEQGEKDEIIAKIGKDLFTEFCLIGFIREGMSGNWIERWQITSFGKEQMRSYLEFYEMGRELNDICVGLDISC